MRCGESGEVGDGAVEAREIEELDSRGIRQSKISAVAANRKSRSIVVGRRTTNKRSVTQTVRLRKRYNGRNSMARWLIFVVTSVAVLASLCGAQMRGGYHGGGRGFGSAPGQSPLGQSSFGHHRNNVPRGYFAGDTAFLFDDYPFSPATPEYTPPYLVMQAPVAAEAAPAPRVASLLIELQGDRYVRYGGMARSEDADVRSRDVPGLAARSGGEVSVAPPNLVATVLVYRDGRHEEVADYAIVGRTMYAHRSNSGDGQIEYGLANIQLSALDIAATTAANRENGVSFVLPTAANQVVTRP
jgi:hypothetical protein